MNRVSSSRNYIQRATCLPWIHTFPPLLLLLLGFSFVFMMMMMMLGSWISFLASEHFHRKAPISLRSDPQLVLNVDGEQSSKEKPWVETLSWESRAFLYHNFLSKKECEYLISQATPHMVKSTVVDNETGKSKDSRVRTSTGMFFERGRDRILQTIEERIADFTYIPIEHGEGIQVLHYEVGQKYDAHFDYFSDPYNIQNGGQRQATMLMYLSNVEAGGETIFPSANVNKSVVVYKKDGLSECGQSGLAVKPRRGDALLFWSMRPDTSVDPSSLHASCPVIHGNKWSATKWMHVNEYKM